MKRRLLRWLGPPFAILALTGAVYGFWRLTLDPEVEARNRALDDELLRIEGRNGHLRTEIAGLKQEIKRLREDEGESLHRARTGLGMVRPGETVYQLTPAPPSMQVRATPDQAGAGQPAPGAPESGREP
jgi:cell division protein FtsB